MNRVKCLKPLENCTRLEELYLRKNEISSLSELEHLKDLKFLKILWIDENPCTSDSKHRAKVLQILPNLTRLDDKRTCHCYFFVELSSTQSVQCASHNDMLRIELLLFRYNKELTTCTLISIHSLNSLFSSANCT